MSLLGAVEAGVEVAFAVAHELVTVGTYHRKITEAQTYDPITDTTSPSNQPVSNVRFLKVAAANEEREASPVAISDVKFLVPASDMPDDFDRPGNSDQMSPGDGVLYNVVADKFVPGKKIYIIFGRAA